MNTKEIELFSEYAEAIKHEWLETNGLGGYASSTVLGTLTRRYHGLLIAAMNPPVERWVMVSKIDEVVWKHGQQFDLSTNNYGNSIHPKGYKHLVKFKRDIFPEFYYEIGDTLLKKTIFCPQGENTTGIIYEVIRSSDTFSLELTPFMTPRDFHGMAKATPFQNTDVNFRDGVLHYKAYDQAPNVFLSAPKATYKHRPDWYYHFEYQVEMERGQEAHEDLFTPGKLYIDLSEGSSFGIILSTENPSGRDVFQMRAVEELRRKNLLHSIPTHRALKRLALAGDQFIVNRGDKLKSIIAGYHWFSDWGRDTMIALPGLCLHTDRVEDAKKILKAFAERVDQGMIPNRFPDDGQQPEYNTVDASLWFFIAAYRYFQHTGDGDFICEHLLPALSQVIFYYENGTRYNIKVAEDGMVEAGSHGIQLTWMDAKAGDWVVTPREGKAVEINALWYNALKIFARFKNLCGASELAAVYNRKAERVRRAFVDLFWNEEKGCLYDVIKEGSADSAVRPNQLFAIGLPHPLLDKTTAASMMKVVREQLYTPMGLRSLSPLDPAYKAAYTGDRYQRDGAYHQGVVWSWLLGMYADALWYVDGDLATKEIEKVVENILPHVDEAGVGTISEIFEGEAPFAPKGCIAQAWSVAELIRIWMHYKLFQDSPELSSPLPQEAAQKVNAKESYKLIPAL